MTEKALTLTDQSLAWALPLPESVALSLYSKPVRFIYTLTNRGHVPVKIQRIKLDPGEDPRIGIVGGTCYMGLALAPQATCTLEIKINPTALGPIQHVLNIEHSGQFSPLWTELFFTVVEERKATRKPGYLVDETRRMARQQRLLEQEGHRHFARVNAREHPEQEPTASPGGEIQNNILQNPWLNSQRFDGIDPNLNPEPPLNSEARREFDNERREQEMEKQLRLGNVPRVSPAPKPQGF